MKWSKILLVGLVCGLSVSTFGTVWADNYYFFNPETLNLHPGDAFEWHLWMENDFELAGYQFKVHAPSGGATIFDPDTVTADWAGSAADYFVPGIGAFYFHPADDYFIGGYARLLPSDSVPPGTHIAVTLLAKVSDIASPVLYQFSPFSEDCYFLDRLGVPHLAGLVPGYIKVTEEAKCGDVNLDGKVNFADALYLKNYYYQTPPGSPPPCEPPKDASFGQRRMDKQD